MKVKVKMKVKMRKEIAGKGEGKGKGEGTRLASYPVTSYVTNYKKPEKQKGKREKK